MYTLVISSPAFPLVLYCLFVFLIETVCTLFFSQAGAIFGATKDITAAIAAEYPSLLPPQISGPYVFFVTSLLIITGGVIFACVCDPGNPYNQGKALREKQLKLNVK
jgi:hypothetical protein